MPDGIEFEERWREILDFERDWWKTSSPKEVAVRQRFGISSARYYQLLNRAIDRTDALQYDPMLVQRLRRLREARRRERFATRVGREG
jgi:Protein of unknown function (DUF3263)